MRTSYALMRQLDAAASSVGMVGFAGKVKAMSYYRTEWSEVPMLPLAPEEFSNEIPSRSEQAREEYKKAETWL